MTGLRRNLFRALLAAIFLIAGLAMIVSPARYKVDLDTLSEIWGDVFRDLDRVVKTVRISTGLEVEYGNEIARAYWREAGGAADRAYVAAVGARVAAQARRQELPWTFQVVDARYPNAWAILGGHVYVTTAMLDLIDSEAELAALLGHEIAHVDLMHCVDLVQNRLLLEHAGMDAAAFLLSIAEDLMRAGYSEVQESEADRYGMLLAAKAGYSPLNALDTFRKFYLSEEFAPAQDRPEGGPEAEIIDSIGQVLRDYFDTHPPFVERLDALRFLLDTNANGWEGQTFRVGRTAYADRTYEAGDAPPDETWTFSEDDADYLAVRAELAFLLGRVEEAARYLEWLRLTSQEDDRINRLAALLAGEIQPERKSINPPSEPATETPDRKIAEEVSDLAHEGYDAFKLGRYSEAIEKMERAIDRESEYNWALNNLAWVYVSAGLPEYRKPERAVALATRAIEIRPKSDYFDTQGAAYILLGEHVLAFEAYNRAAAQDAKYRERLRKDLDYLGYLAGDAPASDISGALQELIETGRAPFVLADSIARIRRLTTSNTAQARAEYDLLADVYPFHPEIEALAAELGIANPTARIAELSAAGDHAAAVELGRDLLSKNPVDTSIIDRALSSALFALAREEAGGGALEAALAHYSEAIDLRDGDFAAALNNRALLRAKGDDTYLALLDINRDIVLDPENSLYHANQ